MSEFKMIPLKEIKPDPNQPRKFFNPASMDELTVSIKQQGVLQPVLVRLDGKAYSLVCGERRFRAATAAGLAEIPAVVRILSDEETVEIQFIENIQRDDVHPMDEATTFKQMLENKVHAYTMADIAAKINKPESYVAHRLALNNLIPELQKDFWTGRFLIGHAILFARLAKEDQKEVFKHSKEWSGKEYKSINDLKDVIERNVMRVLSKAPFKKEDATLNPEMGACTTCAFRSGNSPALFDDIKEKDRCFKPACFEKKVSVHTLKAVTEALEQEPDTVYLFSEHARYKPDAAITKLLEHYNIKPLRDYHDYSTYIGKGDKKIKGLWINGDKCGSIQYVTLSHKRSEVAKSKESTGVINIDLEIDGIKQRTKRAAELDDEKVWNEVRSLSKDKLFLANPSALKPEEITAAIVAMHDKAGYDGAKKIEQLLQKSSSESIAKMSWVQTDLLRVMRYFIANICDVAQRSHNTGGPQRALYNVLNGYFPDKIKAIENMWLDKRTKREERAQQRIKALQEQKKEIKPKPAPKKAAVKKPVKRSASKKTAKKK